MYWLIAWMPTSGGPPSPGCASPFVGLPPSLIVYRLQEGLAGYHGTAQGDKGSLVPLLQGANRRRRELTLVPRWTGTSVRR